MAHDFAGDTAFEEALEFGEEDVQDRCQLQPISGLLLDQLGSVANQQPKSIGAAWTTVQEPTLVPETITFVQQTSNQTRVECVGANAVFKSDGVRTILTPIMVPKAKAHAQRWIGSFRRECLDSMLIVKSATPGSGSG